MNSYTLLSGETVTFPDPPLALAEFLARVQAAADDPNVSVPELMALIYGAENPLLDTTSMPGRALVTPAVFENPVYHVLADQIGRKQVALGLLDLAAADARYTLTVPAVAQRLGLSEESVHEALKGRWFAAIFRDGQWLITPESADAYKLSSHYAKRSAGTNGAAAPAASALLSRQSQPQ